MPQRKFFVRAAGIVLSLLFVGITPVSMAQEWPAKPVKLVVPFAAGGTTDVIARLVALKLSERWKQSVVVENRLGAGGSIGADAVAKSPPDGYTLLLHSGAITINPHINRKLPFDTEKDLLPITNIAAGPMLVVVPDRSPIRNLRELVTTAKAKPGALNFGSAGVGSQVHMAGENFAHVAGVEVTHVPYKGESVAYNDLIASQLDFMVGNFAATSALLGTGRLRALATTGKTRSPLLPDVPTAAEAGLPQLESTGWFGLFAPAGTPRDVLAKIHRDIGAVLADNDLKARFHVQGMQPVGNSPDEFARAMKAESAQWATVVKTRKLAQN